MKKKYIIYARESCPYCKRILHHMKKKNKSFIYLVLYNLEEDLAEIKERYNWPTVPMVVELGGEDGEEKFIGGCDDTIQYFEREQT